MAAKQIICSVCGEKCTALSSKRRFCSDRCRMRFNRSVKASPAYIASLVNAEHNKSM